MRKQEAVTGHFNPDGKRETDVIWAEKQQLTKLKIADYSYYKEGCFYGCVSREETKNHFHGRVTDFLKSYDLLFIIYAEVVVTALLALAKWGLM